jgi:hypothetical protein
VLHFCECAAAATASVFVCLNDVLPRILPGVVRLGSGHTTSDAADDDNRTIVPSGITTSNDRNELREQPEHLNWILIASTTTKGWCERAQSAQDTLITNVNKGQHCKTLHSMNKSKEREKKYLHVLFR